LMYIADNMSKRKKKNDSVYNKTGKPSFVLCVHRLGKDL